MATASLTVALAGNPNCGKTTIFNNITGARQHVGNYPGVTVERREGFRRFQGIDLLLVDLPGTYSLTAHSLDEVVARAVIIDEKPDIIINILDASNLERNLYLAVQLLELERPLVLALNMSDVAEQKGQKLDMEELSRILGISVVRMVGNRNKGTEELLQTVAEAALAGKQQPFVLDYGPTVEVGITKVTEALATLTDLKYPTRWLALKLLEKDKDVLDVITAVPGGRQVMAVVEKAQAELKAALGDELEMVIAEIRYRFVGEVYRRITSVSGQQQQTVSDKIDRLVTHRVLGLPIFFGIMWLLFNMVFTLGAYPQEWIETGMGRLGEVIGSKMAAGDLRSLLVDAIIGGVGGVLVFLPNILILFFGIAMLEDTGYMARAAFVMDRIMRALGLHGKSFIPMLVGFGCNVPAIMGTRSLENPRDRMVTILVAPLMSCSARLPVYTLLIGAFFAEEWAGTVLFSIYILGVVLAVTLAMLFRKRLFPGAMEAFVMEMPPYHLPTLRSILTHMWERSALYLKKAGTLILSASILVWFTTNYPGDVSYSKDYAASMTSVRQEYDAKIVRQVFAPLGATSLAGSAELNEAISRIRQLEDLEGVSSATLRPPVSSAGVEAVTAATAKAPGAKGLKLAEFAQAHPAIYPLAVKYLELERQRDEDLRQLKSEQAGEKLANSYAGRFGQLLEPLVKPLGFDWKIAVGLVTAVAAKEIMVSTLGTIYSVGEVDEDDMTSLQSALLSDPTFTPLVAYSLMVFTLIYSPCLAALSVMRRETNSWKWTAFSFVYSTLLAWVAAFIIHQAGIALGF